MNSNYSLPVRIPTTTIYITNHDRPCDSKDKINNKSEFNKKILDKITEDLVIAADVHSASIQDRDGALSLFFYRLNRKRQHYRSFLPIKDT